MATSIHVHPVLPSVIRDGGNEVRWLPDTLQSLIICAFRHMAVDIGNWDIFGIPGASFIHFRRSKQFYDVSCSFISPHHSQLLGPGVVHWHLARHSPADSCTAGTRPGACGVSPSGSCRVTWNRYRRCRRLVSHRKFRPASTISPSSTILVYLQNNVVVVVGAE